MYGFWLFEEHEVYLSSSDTRCRFNAFGQQCGFGMSEWSHSKMRSAPMVPKNSAIVGDWV